jgi:two-component system chemotaxis sensor kinase CheA
LRAIQVHDDDIGSLADLPRRGVDATTIVQELERLLFEPVERSLVRLARHAEALSTRLGKVDLDVQVDAAAMRLDPDRWGPLWSALVHVVRNAVDHGIELPDERALLGKPVRASLRLSAREDRGGYRFQVADDGRGIDWDAVRRLCKQRGTPAQTHADLVAALLTPNFTTRQQATAVSGRGVGLAAVASVVKERRGTVDVESQPGCGACWTLDFPELSETGRQHAD